MFVQNSGEESAGGEGPAAGISLLLLGWSPEQAPLGLAGLGALVTCVTSSAEAPAARASGVLARLVVVPDPADVEGVVSGLARAGLAPGDFSLVCSAHEFTLVAASVVAVLGGAASLPVPVAVALRDKYVQKARLRDAGVAVADFATADSPLAVAGVADRLGGYPVVVKPIAGAGALHTVRLDSAAEAEKWADRAAVLPWLVERYVSGAEVHIDGFVRAGEVGFVSVARYLTNLIELHEGEALVGSVAVRPGEEPGLYARAGDLVRASLRALGHTDGVFHLEAFEQEDGSLVFGECGGRVGGGRVDHMVERTFGVDLHQQWVTSVLQVPADPVPQTSETGSYGWVHLSAPPGRVLSVPGREEVLGREGVVEVELRAKAGDVVSARRPDSRTRAARALVTGRDVGEVRDRIAALEKWFRARVEVERGGDGDSVEGVASVVSSGASVSTVSSVGSVGS